MAMNKGLKIAIGVATIGFVGVGVYFLYKKVIKPRKERKEEEKKAQAKPPITEQEVKSTSYNKKPSASKLGKTPFKNSTEGNAFRQWINDTYPKYAKKIDLDPTGSYDNAYIRKAWKEYGKEYGDAKKNEGAVYTATYGAKFKKLLNDWNKSHLLSESTTTKGVPYFELNMGIIGGKKMGCLWNIYIYDRKKGENVGGTNGEGFWKITKKNSSGSWETISQGRWDDDLRTLKVTSGTNKGQTYSGGKNVGTKFSQILSNSDTALKWC
jgi:hypothetical protein